MLFWNKLWLRKINVFNHLAFIQLFQVFIGYKCRFHMYTTCRCVSYIGDRDLVRTCSKINNVSESIPINPTLWMATNIFFICMANKWLNSVTVYTISEVQTVHVSVCVRVCVCGGGGWGWEGILYTDSTNVIYWLQMCFSHVCLLRGFNQWPLTDFWRPTPRILRASFWENI